MARQRRLQIEKLAFAPFPLATPPTIAEVEIALTGSLANDLICLGHWKEVHHASSAIRDSWRDSLRRPGVHLRRTAAGSAQGHQGRIRHTAAARKAHQGLQCSRC